MTYERPPYDDPNRDVFALNPRTGRVTRLTDDPAGDYSPRWSPDGTRIVFTSERDDSRDIWVMDADGSGQRRVTTSSASEFDPAWSPDGTRVAYARAEDETDTNIYAVSVDDPAAMPVQLTDAAGFDDQPSWSPDGRTIAFDSRRTGSIDIWTMDADGSNQRQGTTGRPSAFADWSPDGARIAFSTSAGQGETGIHIASPGIPGSTPLTSGPNYDLEPAWAPSGTSLVFARGSDLFVIDDVRSADPPRLLLDDGAAEDPDWQAQPAGSPPGGGPGAPGGPGGPGGGAAAPGAGGSGGGGASGGGAQATNGRIAFARDGDIWLVDGDGSDERRITSGPATDRDPAWSPINRVTGRRRLAFVRGSDLMVVDPDTDTERRNAIGRLMDGYSLGAHPSWSPTGDRIVWETNERRRTTVGVYSVDARELRTGTRSRPLRIGGEGPTRMPAWSPATNRVAYLQLGVGTCFMSGFGGGRVCPPASTSLLAGASSYPVYEPLLDTWEPDWLPDGESLLVTSRAQG